VYRKVEKYGCYAPQLYMNIHTPLHEKLNDLLKVEKRNSFGTL
jgi:hypothetical protein